MDRLQAMRTLCAVIEAGSYTAAADVLGTTHSTASRQIKELESALGVQLLNRNTRGFALTSAGEQYYRSCVDVLGRIADAEQALAQQQTQVKGNLRLSLPLAVGVLEQADWLPAFAARYPSIDVELQCTDRMVDLVAEGIDVALRITTDLPDSRLAVRKLVESPLVLVAAPAYIAQHGVVDAVDQLARQRLLVYAPDRRQVTWHLHSADGAVQAMTPVPSMRTDTIAAAYAASLAGMGIAVFTWHTVRAALARGQLVQVLPGVNAGRYHYFALYPATRYVAPAVRAFVDFMVQHYR